jgi:hypothetical protein
MPTLSLPVLAAWITAKGGHRHMCVLYESTWFTLCGGVILDTEDGPRIPPRCYRCLAGSQEVSGLVIVPAESEIRI